MLDSCGLILSIAHLTDNELETLRRNIFEVKFRRNDEKTSYCVSVIKLDRHGYKQRSRILLLTNAAIYLLNDKDMKPKHRLPYKSVNGVVTSDLSDGIVIIRIPPELKEDKVGTADSPTIFNNYMESFDLAICVTGRFDPRLARQSDRSGHQNDDYD